MSRPPPAGIYFVEPQAPDRREGFWRDMETTQRVSTHLDARMMTESLIRRRALIEHDGARADAFTVSRILARERELRDAARARGFLSRQGICVARGFLVMEA
jgi:hypothetical protein